MRVAQNVRGFNTNTSKMMVHECAKVRNLCKIKEKTGAIARCANVRGFKTNKNKMMARACARSEKREVVR